MWSPAAPSCTARARLFVVASHLFLPGLQRASVRSREDMTDDARVAQFRVLYDSGYPRIVAYALRRARSQDEAYDIVGDIFMTAWRRLDDMPSEEARIAWLYGIARRVLSNHYRSADRRKRLVDRLETAAPATSSTADDGPEVVRVALSRIRPDDREILTLATWDDLTNDEIAVALDATSATVALRLHRARGRLAKELGRLGYAPQGQHDVQSGEVSRTLNTVNGIDPPPYEEAET